MRLLYFILYSYLPYSLRIYYPRIKRINSPRKYLSRTIYVSNHAASFMDPVLLGGLQRPIVFFMTRSDIFTPLMKPILWMAHMLPIYRQHDGVDTKEKNAETFDKCTSVLKSGRNLLIFGEGFTDDVFIRRLKPLKKGALRIGFGTLEAMNWSKDIYVATIGVNYGDPNRIGSDLVVSNGPSICLNDYKEAYLANPNRVINELNHRIEKDLQNQLTHVENLKWVFFHEHVSRLLKEYMHPIDRDTSVPLLKRWQNSRELALWMNGKDLDNDADLVKLKADLEVYFKLLKKLKVEEKELEEAADNKVNKAGKMMKLILLAPISLLGLLHNYIPYTFVKRFVEKSFRRRVFWSSVKMNMGGAVITVFNIPIIFALHYWVFKPLMGQHSGYAWIISLTYFLLIPLLGVVAYNSARTLRNLKVHERIRTSNMDAIFAKRKELIERTRSLIFR